MKKRVLVIPLDTIIDELFAVLHELNDQNAVAARAKADLLSRLRAAGQTTEVEWPSQP